MKRLSDFLGRFKKYADQSDLAQEVVFNTLNTVGFSILDKKNIVLQGKGVSIKLSPLQKNELFLKQGKILSLLKKNPLTAHIEHIRGV